jgi:hypothetical protein
VPLPFVIQDGTAHDLRVPPGTATEHPLGASGVAGLVILVPDLDRAAKAYEVLLGVPGRETEATIDGARRARRFPLGAQWIDLVEPEARAAALQQHIRDRGAAPYDIVLAGAGSSAAVLPTSRTHQSRIRVEPVAVLAR